MKIADLIGNIRGLKRNNMIKKLIERLKTKKFITVESHTVILTQDLLINEHCSREKRNKNIKIKPI